MLYSERSLGGLLISQSQVIQPVGDWVCDAWPVRRQTYGYLPSHRPSPPNGRYQFILLGEQRHTVWTAWTRDPRNCMVCGLEGQGNGVSKCIFSHNDYYAYVDWQQQYGVGLNSLSAFYRVAQKRAILSDCKYSENFMTELRRNIANIFLLPYSL